MIFDIVKDYAPFSYSDSRDYRIFLKELGMLTSIFKYNIDTLPDLYDADRCIVHMLPLLASMVGYKYKNSKSVESNREIIKYFPYLLRNRGSEYGMRLAVALSINTSDRDKPIYYSSDNIYISPNVKEGTITIYYPEGCEIDMELIEAVRPVGMRIVLQPSDFESDNTSEELDLKVGAKVTSRNQYYDQSYVDNSPVGFDIPTDFNDEEVL